MKHYSFPKIRQYHQVLRDLKLQLSYVGKDDEGNPIYKEPDTWPTFTFEGRVKLHGTNAAIVFSPDGSFYCQSRENIINEISDNAGFAHWANKEGKNIWQQIKQFFGRDCIKHVVCFGEWCGGSIQKGVALNELDKRFVVFGLKTIFDDDSSYWLDPSAIKDHSINIFNIFDYPKYQIEVDLNRPDKAIEKMVELTTAVGDECPFAKAFVDDSYTFEFISDNNIKWESEPKIFKDLVDKQVKEWAKANLKTGDVVNFVIDLS